MLRRLCLNLILFTVFSSMVHGASVDLEKPEHLLSAGHPAKALRAAAPLSYDFLDFTRSVRLLELRVQALLARGRYQAARQEVDYWFMSLSKDPDKAACFESDVSNVRLLKRHLLTLERFQGVKGKPILTASVPKSQKKWSHRHQIPVYFFRLVPVNTGSSQIEGVTDPVQKPYLDFYRELTESMNLGFQELSGNQFSLSFKGLNTLYIQSKPWDSEGDPLALTADSRPLTSRVYLQSIPSLYELSGKAFVVVVDYRPEAGHEAAYAGDGLVYVPLSRLRKMVLMHEILHGLGATHQDCNALAPAHRGLMTFENGKLLYFGLEEKNRLVLGWPQVTVRKIYTEEPQLASEKMTPRHPNPMSQYLLSEWLR